MTKNNAFIVSKNIKKFLKTKPTGKKAIRRFENHHPRKNVSTPYK